MHIEGFAAANVEDVVEIEVEAEIVEEAGIVEVGVGVEVTSIKNYGKKLFFFYKNFSKNFYRE